jgi:phosphoenolpyruvate-protein phosphotransferase (PTS system enzyme I)
MPHRLQGIGVSPGIAIGPVHLVGVVQVDQVEAGTPGEERATLDAAVTSSVRQLERLAARLRAEGHEDEAGIMEAQALMAQDPSFLDLAREGIVGGAPAVRAVQRAASHFKALFEGIDDPYLAGRAADVQDVADRVSRQIVGEEVEDFSAGAIVVAHDLTPSQTASFDRALVMGIATEVGSTTSHSAILARALDIPAVLGLKGLLNAVRDGDEIILDGAAGIVILEPGEAEKSAYAAKASEDLAARRDMQALRYEPAETRDGHRVTLAANIGSPAELPAALDAGAEGVGLFRTEFLFAGRTELPDEEEQFEAYRAVLETMAPYTVVIRTLDVGGDKPLPYLAGAVEANPFLGERGIRFTEAHPEVFRTQLRALLRASPSGSLAIMLPMVSHLKQIQDAASLLGEIRCDVGGSADLGIMIEVPAAATMADQLARHVNFFSVGTNDLVQYGLAVDRTNERAASLYSPLHPGILRLLQLAVEGAHRHSRWAGMCGEMAGDLTAIPILLGLGFDELSMTPSRIPVAKTRIRELSFGRCREIAEKALLCESPEEVESLVRDM